MRLGLVRSARVTCDRGAALVIVLMAMVLLSALGALALATTVVEGGSAFNYHAAEAALEVAWAGLSRAMADLRVAPSWDDVIQGRVQSPFVDGPPTGTRSVMGRREVDMARVISLARCGRVRPCTDAEVRVVSAERPWGANNPLWHPYAYGFLHRISPVLSAAAPWYLVVLVGDDPDDRDGDPWRHGGPLPAVVVRATAFGVGGTTRTIEALVTRMPSVDGAGLEGTIRLVSWQERR